MKRIYGGLFLVLAFLISGNVFAQNTVLGRPTFEKTFYEHTYLDENGAVKIREMSKVFTWPYFVDELIIKWNKPKGSSLSIYVARIPSLEKAVSQGMIKEIIDPIPFRRNGYHFSREDLVMQAESGIDRFYSIRLRTTTPNQLYFLAEEFKKDPAIESVDLSAVFKVANHTYNDPLFKKQWNVPKVSTSQAHEITFGSQDVYVFVDDTGVFLDHEDIDRGRNFFDYDATTNTEIGDDDFGHGTHVYTTICAATNNGRGIVGLAPNVRCGIIKTLIFGSGSSEMVANGFLVAASKAMEIKQLNPQAQFVMNVSLGGYSRSAVIDAAVEVARKAGVLIIAAAGNKSTNIDINPYTPASSPGVIAVAATDKMDRLADFSNFGLKTVFLAAPGVGIWAGVPNQGVPVADLTGYDFLDGTSMAAPHVTAYAALVLSTDNFTEERIKFLLFANNDDIKGLPRFVASGGRINLLLGLDTPKIPPDSPSELNVDMGTSHSSARFAWISPGDSDGQKIAGARLYFSTKEFNEENLNSSNKDVKTLNLFPLRKGSGETVHTILSDLPENTSHCAALQVFDRGGNFSPLGSITRFKTKESKRFILRTFETANGKADPGNWIVTEGPLGSFIKGLFGENPLLWHLSETGAAGGSPPFAWRYGLEKKLNYEDVVADAIIISEVFDARTTMGLTVRYDKFQQIGDDFFGADAFDLYVKMLDGSNRGDWQLARSYLTAENSKTLRLETIRQDLSVFEGKKFQVGFRFLSASSGQHIGVIFDNIEIRVDE